MNDYVLVSGNDPGCAGYYGFYNAKSIAICPPGYKVLGVGYIQGSFCPSNGSGVGLSGVVPYDDSVAVWPVDGYSYTYIAQAKCGK